MTEEKKNHLNIVELARGWNPHNLCLLLWVLFVIDKQPWICCWFKDTAVVRLKANLNCIIGAYFKSVSLFSATVYVLLYGAMTQQCLETPGDFCSSSRKSIYCMWGCPLVEWLSTEPLLSAHCSPWVLTLVPDLWHRQTLLCCRLNLAKAFGFITVLHHALPLYLQ